MYVREKVLREVLVQAADDWENGSKQAALTIVLIEIAFQLAKLVNVTRTYDE